LRRQFRIDWYGLHGAAHWARVRHYGLAIGRDSGADLVLVELFAFLHDSQRIDEYRDEPHGRRAAKYIRSINGQYFDLDAARLSVLCEAVTGHSGGGVHPDPTIQTCWDGDRLDLGRVGTKPAARYLSHHAWPHIEPAYARSLKRDW
jgi:uncharacterized protein